MITRTEKEGKKTGERAVSYGGFRNISRDCERATEKTVSRHDLPLPLPPKRGGPSGIGKLAKQRFWGPYVRSLSGPRFN